METNPTRPDRCRCRFAAAAPLGKGSQRQLRPCPLGVPFRAPQRGDRGEASECLRPPCRRRRLSDLFKLRGVREIVERAEHVVEEVDDRTGPDAFCMGSESDDVGKQDRDVGLALGDRGAPLPELMRDRGREDVEQQPLGAVRLNLEEAVALRESGTGPVALTREVGQGKERGHRRPGKVQRPQSCPDPESM